MRRGIANIFQYFLHRSERLLIRVMILASVALVIAQMGLAKDPVTFYLAMAEKVEYPALDMPAAKVDVQKDTYQIVLKAAPSAAVKVWQNGKQIGDLKKGEQTLSVQKGQILLDGRGITSAVRVQVIQKDSALQEPRLNQTFMVQGNIQTVSISP